MDGYSIENNNGRVIVRGTLPLDEFGALTKAWRKRGIDSMAIGVSTALGATLAVCRKEDVEPWTQEVAKQAATKANGDAELEWLLGPDTGTSSKSMFSVFAKGMLGVRALESLKSWGPDTPHDPDDFGRCYRLLEKFPAWRERLNEVAEKLPKWGPMVREWGRMEELWREELPKKSCPKLYDLMQQLEREGEKIVKQRRATKDS